MNGMKLSRKKNVLDKGERESMEARKLKTAWGILGRGRH